MTTSPRVRWGGTFLMVAGVLILLAAAAAWYILPVQYEVYALLRVASKPPVVLVAEPAASEEFSVFKRTQVLLILSNVVLMGTLHQPDIWKLSQVQAHNDDPISWLKDRLTIDYPDDAEIMRIAMSSANAPEAVKIVDKVVDVYLKKIVQHDKQVHRDNEENLRRAYEQQSFDYQKGLDALRTLESIHKTSGSEAAQLKKKMAIEDLQMFVGQRARIVEDLRQTELDIALAKARSEPAPEVRTAQPAAAKTEPAPDSLVLLEKKKQVLEGQLLNTEDSLQRMIETVASLESFSAQVAAKQEELNQLRAIKNQLGAELDRIQVERLAPDRITRLDKAVISSVRGDEVRRGVALSALAAVGLVLSAVGLMIWLPRR